ncbi:Fe-S cluster assembly protein SufB [Fimbriimonas ginsengisoli]|uniref:Iron-sulfur cluster assembly protein SufB n=1 Tax=Fimbriimonas ginsengisoli Gsoil 348 TaxID=661478 RepID=A0A068NQU4_FIMGI|nr:Fe-S cluster assembly protein SufB [Fimbriimonas ginsengisoli]AIE85752.1 Iron-sulfur cluster assembly protein SufB [Fimbriimonas ginsengisoli Gsoil 348]
MSEQVLDESTALLESFANREYEHGWSTDIESDTLPPGLNEDVVRVISAKKEEPQWLLDWRLKAYRHLLTMKEPKWPNVKYPPIDLNSISYYSAPKKKPVLDSLEDADPEILRTFQKLGIPVEEQKVLLNVKGAAASAADARQAPDKPLSGIAVDAVFDSVSVVTTFKKELFKLGIIFCSIQEAVREHPELVLKHLGSVVPYSDNFFATLNSAVFSDGSFVYIPKGVRCPMELSTYFRINAENTGQFERTLIIAEEGSYVSYLEGCTAPMRDENQLHAAVVELVAAGDDAIIKYSTVQNWYPGDPKTGKGGIYNFVTKRARAIGKRSKVTWTQVETGSAITWKYPSVILQGDDSVGEFYSVALTANQQQADTGTKMIHIGKRTKSTIVSKGISAGHGQNTYRGLVKVNPGADGARNYSQCDSMLMGDRCGAHTFPYIEVKNPTATVEHEASTSKIGEDQIFYCNQRGIPTEDAVNMIVSGFCKEVFRELPMEFAVEAQKLLGVSLEGSVG